MLSVSKKKIKTKPGIEYLTKNFRSYATNVYLFKVNKRNIRRGCETCPNLTKRHQNDATDCSYKADQTLQPSKHLLIKVNNKNTRKDLKHVQS